MVGETVRSFGEVLRQHRVAARLAQEELAERAGLSVRGIRALEAGERTHPQKETLRLLAGALGLSHVEHQALLEISRQGGRPVLVGFKRSLPSATTLPLPLTPFIGRKQEIPAVTHLVRQAQVRLLTLTGLGGVGKTRLALQVATSLQDCFEQGVIFVPLASLSDPTLVPSAVAQVVGVQEQGERSITETLIAALRHRHLLVVLDNLEHLLPASALVAQLLQAAPSLHLLITSRVPLHITGEHEYAVPPLCLPAPQRTLSLETMARSEAVTLFVTRAQAVKAGFRLTEDNAPAIGEICRRLDGLPLAIELAAARSKLFPPAALLARLSPALPLLTGGPRDLPARLQTVRGAIDWSYGWLGPREQRLFARLAVFAGGGPLEAVEAICDLEGDENLLEQLSALLDHSLVRQEGAEEPRVVLLETIREYAEERLEARDEKDALRERHAQWFMTWADQAGREMGGPLRAQPSDHLARRPRRPGPRTGKPEAPCHRARPPGRSGRHAWRCSAGQSAWRGESGALPPIGGHAGCPPGAPRCCLCRLWRGGAVEGSNPGRGDSFPAPSIPSGERHAGVV